MEGRGPALIAWDKVCMPKDQGGLGVLNIDIHNKCLLVKHLHKFLHKENLPWVHLIWDSYYLDGVITNRNVGSLWWKSIFKLLPEFKTVAKGSWAQETLLIFGWTMGAWHHET